MASKGPATANKPAPQPRKEDGPVPNPLIAIRTKQSVTFLQGPFEKGYKGERIPGISIDKPQSDIVFTHDGGRCAVATSEGIKVYDCAPKREGDGFAPNSLTLINTIAYNTARFVELSPLGNFLVSYETYRKEVPENHIVWDVATGEPVLKFTQKLDLSSSTHALIQWTADEKYVCILAPGEVKVYDGHNPTNYLARVQHGKLNAFLVSPANKEGEYSIAVFSPVQGTAPAKVAVYKVHEVAAGKSFLPPPPPPSPADIACGRVKPNQIQKEGKTVPLQPTTTLSFFKASEANMDWHSNGVSLLIRTSAEDGTGESYYGESRLYFLQGDNSFNCTVSFGANKGPIHDIAWSPRHLEFTTLQGEAKAAKATIWSVKDKDCVPVKEMGTGPWNMIQYNHSGRFVALAGFGSLAGRVEVWDKNKLVRLAQFQDPDSPRVLQWSPCGRYFITATLFPWLRVGNTFKIYTYDGNVVYKELPGTVVPTDEPHFCQVAFRKAAADVYPDKPADPAVMDKAQKAMQNPAAAPKGAAPARSYVPPHLRAQGVTSVASTGMSVASSGPRDLVKEKKKGNVVGDIGGAVKVDKANMEENVQQMANMRVNTQSRWR